MTVADDLATARAGLAQASDALDRVDAFLTDLASLEATQNAPGAVAAPSQDSSSTGGPLPDGTPSTGAVSSGDASTVTSSAATSPADTSAAPAVTDTESPAEDATETVEEAPPAVLADGTPVASPATTTATS